MATWHTIESARAQWREAPSDDVLTELLETSQDAVLAYAQSIDMPPAPNPLPIPFDYDDYVREADTVIKTRWRRAQLLNMQDECNSQNQSSNSDSDAQGFDGVGGDSRVYRLSLRAKRLLRPESATEGLVG